MSTPAKKAAPSVVEKADVQGDETSKDTEANLRNELNKSNAENDKLKTENEDLKSRLEKLEEQIKSVKNDETQIRKTPNELAGETPDETKARYGYSDTPTAEDIANPHVQVYADTIVKQIPSGTHLHPDIAADLQNRGITEMTTDSAVVKRTTYEYDYADPIDEKTGKKLNQQSETEANARA